MSKGKFVDLVGQRFGRLLVITRVPNKKGRVAFSCDCDCGNKGVETLAGSLRHFHTSSCGCLHKEMHSKDLTGMSFGLWQPIRPIERRSKNGYRYWLTICTGCDKEHEVSGESLINGKSMSCRKCAGKARSRQFCFKGHDTHIWGRTKSQACRACLKDKQYREHYGISLEEFIKMYEYQGGRCAICKKELGLYYPKEPGFYKGCRVEVDHDHKKGKRESVRGLLCGGRWAGCNRKLGRIDNLEWLANVVNYLETLPGQKVLKALRDQEESN